MSSGKKSAEPPARAAVPPARSGSIPGVDQSFQNLLLELSAAAAQGSDFDALVRLFCRCTREFFKVTGVYCWKLMAEGELYGLHGDGSMATRFIGARLSLSEKSLARQALSERRTLFVLDTHPGIHPFPIPVRSLMAAPLIVAGDAIGALVFVHDTDPHFFNEDIAAKATILAGLLGGLMDASRLTRDSREERRRAELLVQCAQVLHSHLDVSATVNALVQRVCDLLRARIVVVLMREGERFVMKGIAAENPELAARVREVHAAGGCLLAKELAFQAAEASGVIVVPVDPKRADLPEFITTGEILAAPIRTPGSTGALLVYCGGECAFTQDQRELIGAVAGLGGLAISNAELYATANARARELRQLLDISSELGGLGELDTFLEKFSVRASEFLGFRRSLIALCDGPHCHVRWVAEQGAARPLSVTLPQHVTDRIFAEREPFWSDDVSKLPDADLQTAEKLKVKQYLAVPLLGSGSRLLGLFAVLDRRDGAAISAEDVRRAKALGAEVAIALEAAQNLHLSEDHRRRAESLMSVALELNSSLRLPHSVRSFAQHAAEMLGARAAVLALSQRGQLETVVLHDPAVHADKALLRRLNLALTDLAAQHPNAITCGAAEELLGRGAVSSLSWRDLTVARLNGSDGDLLGLICLADRGAELTEPDRNLLQAVAAHASVAFDNSRLFSRMEQANRHWIEVFDSISDFIVVHDETNKVARVNRSLADFIGVRPSELIGVSMRALVSMATDPGSYGCPFCRAGAEPADEYIHPVLERTYLVSTSRLNDGVQTVHVLKDITDRREAERRYRELFDNIQEGLFFSTPEGRFVEVNDALVRMLGYSSRDELLQLDITSDLYISPEHRKPFCHAIEEKGALRNYQEVLRRKDGALIHTLLNAFAVRDSAGNVVQYRGLILDITELKNFQSELQRERDFNSKVLNNTQSLILVADTAGLISYANKRCYQTGYQQGELLGRKLVDLVPAPRRHAMADALESTLAGHQTDNLDLPILLGGGRIGQFSINLSPMRDEQGNVNSIVVVMTDITDAAMLQAKLMHTEKMAAVGQLVSGVAHEVNNPLTAILGFSDLLLEDGGVPDAAKKDLRVIIQEAQRTKQIVQNLLSFARQMPPQRRPVQLNVILRRTLALRSYDFANHGVEIVERLHECLPDVIGDSHQLQQVFLNILNNAYDAVRETGRPGRIEVETALRDHCAEVVFRDNGPGIMFPDRIFDPFFTTKEVGKGTGLGLSICYGIVHEHGGEITCHNNHTQEGATFLVRLPTFVETAAVSAAAGANG